jgi:PKD repeat protein
MVSRTFAPGIYTISLTVSNACSADDISYTITVAAPSWWLYLPVVSKN